MLIAETCYRLRCDAMDCEEETYDWQEYGEEAEDDAQRDGWRQIGDLWFCRKCAADIARRQPPSHTKHDRPLLEVRT